MRILIVEDSPALLANLYDWFEARGHTLDSARSGPAGLELALTQRFDVLVLDLSLPGMDGLELCRTLRNRQGHRLPVLMLTARDAVAQRVQGLAVGADDYLTKPFAMAELDARLTALVRRAHATPGPVLRIADLSYDVADARAQRAGRRLELTPMERRILELLLRAAPRLVQRDELEHALWPDHAPDSDALRTHIHGLRRVLDRPFEQPLLHTVRGLGWRLCAPGTDSVPPPAAPGVAP